MVATCCLLGVSTRRVEKLAATLGVTQLSKSQVSEIAKVLDARVAEFRNRPLDAGPYTFVWVDALTQKVREGGRVVNVHCLAAVGVNNEGKREVLGIDVASSEDGAGWLAFLRSLTTRGLTGVELVVSDAHEFGVWVATVRALATPGPSPHPQLAVNGRSRWAAPSHSRGARCRGGSAGAVRPAASDVGCDLALI